MHLTTLTLDNFRNFTTAEIDFPQSGLAIAAAPNATGKTNFLESIVVALRGKSFRAPLDECVQWGAQTAVVRATLTHRDSRRATVAVRYHRPDRRLRIEEDSRPASPVTFYSHYPLTLFLPQDTFLFSRGPAERRNILNRALVASSTYVSSLVQYQRALKQRNVALKNATTPNDVAAWTDLVVTHAAPLWKYRHNIATHLNTHLTDSYHRITGEQLPLTAQLIAGTENPAHFRDDLMAAFSLEQRYGYTLYGPHRDDLRLTVADRPLLTALSQGQMRSVVIALKLVMHRFIETITKETPLVLLDEVLSELDEQRQRALLDNLPAAQTIVTTTSLPRGLQHHPDVQLLDIRAILRQQSLPAAKAPAPPAPTTSDDRAEPAASVSADVAVIAEDEPVKAPA